MPDDMLEDSIAIAKKTLDEHDFETDGVEVSRRCVYTHIQNYGFDVKRLIISFGSLDR